MAETMPENMRVLRFFAADDAAWEQALPALRTHDDVQVQQMARGSERLLVLTVNANSAPACRVLLDRCTAELEKTLGASLYGTGDTKLPQAAVAALHAAKQLIVAADEPTGSLLEQRLEHLEGAESVYDFGEQSYAHPRFGAKIAEGGVFGRSADAYIALQGRMIEAYKHSGADYALACMPRPDGCVVLAGRKKGFWVRALPAGENAGLWLLDMVRRAACKLDQAAGTKWCAYGDDGIPASAGAAQHTAKDGLPAGSAVIPAPATDALHAQGSAADTLPAAGSGGGKADPFRRTQAQEPRACGEPPAPPQDGAPEEDEPDGPRHTAAGMLLGLLAVAAVAALALAAAWYFSGGDILSLWEKSGLRQFNVSGASLL